MLKLEISLLERIDMYTRRRGQFTAPQELTQAGLSTYVGADRSNISRTLKELEEQNLILSEKRHIKGRNDNSFCFRGTHNLFGV